MRYIGLRIFEGMGKGTVDAITGFLHAPVSRVGRLREKKL